MLIFCMRLHHVGLAMFKQVVLRDESLAVTQPIVVLWFGCGIAVLSAIIIAWIKRWSKQPC